MPSNKDENTFFKQISTYKTSFWKKKIIGLCFNVAFRCHFKPVFNCSLFQMTL